MKKIVYILVFMLIMGMYVGTSYASEVNEEISVKAKTEYDITDVVEGVRVDEKIITVEMADGTVIRATGEFEDSIRLMVMPITKSMTKEWNWLQSVTRKIGINKSAYDIFFINSAGERVDGGEGSQISVMTRQRLGKLMVYYIEASGKETKLESQMEEYAVKFKMMKNGYYTLVMKDTVMKNNQSTEKNKKKTTTKKETSKDESSKDESSKDEDKEDKDDEQKDDEDTDIVDGGDTGNNDDKESGTKATKKPTDGSGSGAEKEKEDDDGDMNILYRLSIVFVFIATAIIFIIILFKKRKKEEEDEYNN